MWLSSRSESRNMHTLMNSNTTRNTTLTISANTKLRYKYTGRIHLVIKQVVGCSTSSVDRYTYMTFTISTNLLIR